MYASSAAAVRKVKVSLLQTDRQSMPYKQPATHDRDAVRTLACLPPPNA
jgi:hypothetical protein